ncbi:MAG: TMEM165/GDT1 family protein [Cyanobacteria bacterium J06648_11]
MTAVNKASLSLVAFGSIFLAEMGDKTQLATALLSAESHHPLWTFAGAATALIATSLIGVLAGQWVARIVPPKLIKVAAGLGFFAIGSGLLWSTLHDMAII